MEIKAKKAYMNGRKATLSNNNEISPQMGDGERIFF